MNSVKNIARRFLSLSLSLIMVFVLIPSMTITAFAADVTGLTDSNIVLTSSGSGTWSANGQTINGSVSASGGCNSSAQNAQLTIKNNKSVAATLSFSYTLTLNGGSASVGGTAVTANGSFSREIAAGASVNVAITSAKDEGSTTSIVINNISLLADVNANVTFIPGEHGSYTVDGTAITSSTTITKNSSQSFALVATPASGYKFYRWLNVTDNVTLSKSASYTTGFDKDMTVKPEFVPSSSPTFAVSGTEFLDLNEAITYATNNNKSTIVLVDNGTLPAGTYNIPSGKTLLIPFDDAYTVYTTSPTMVYGSHETPSVYKTLTMANNAVINIKSGGAISVPCKYSATGTGAGSWNGTPTGKYGKIAMNSGSKINVESGGALYAYGYISGSGMVDAKSGAKVYEYFQVRSWRGGNATSGLSSTKVFPINQYYVQNIEAYLKLEHGASETVITAVNALSSGYNASATFIGTGGLFIPEGTITKHYDGATDRLIVDVDGNLDINALALKVSSYNLNTSSYVLPITHNITVNVNSGTTKLSQDMAFLPGSIVNIKAGANLEVASGKNIYIYDQSEWGPYAFTGLNMIPVGYSTVNATNAKRNNNSLIDAKFDVNGTITVKGNLYTTTSGANITSSQKTGRIVYNAAAGTATTTQQATQTSNQATVVDIGITAAKLLNGDSSYTATAGTASGEFYTYSSRQNKWIKGEDTVPTYTVTFKDANGTTIKTVDVEEGNTVPAGEVPALPATANHNNGTHTTYAWNASVTAPITAATTFTQVGTTVNCSLVTTATTAATCTSAGTTTETCSVCGYVKTTTIPALGHNFGEWEVTTQPTCVALGEKTRYCSRCDATETEALPTIDHDYSDYEVVAATPNEQGYTKHICTMCGDYYTDSVTPYASDDSALEEARSMADDYLIDYHTQASYEALQNAVNAATTLREGDSPQYQIDEATAAILDAASAMVPYLALTVDGDSADYSINLQTTETEGFYNTVFGADIQLTANEKEGYTFYGWMDTVNRHYVAYDRQYTFTINTNTSLKPVYVKNNSASLIFQNDTGYIKKTVTKTTAQWANVMSIDNLLPELPYSYMKTVIGWDYDNADVLSRLANGEDVTIVPLYAEADPDKPEIPVATDTPLINILYRYDSENQVGSYTIAPSMPATSTVHVEEIGIAYYYEYSDSDSFILSNFHLTNDNRLTTSKFTYDSSENYYTVNVRFGKWRQNNWCARGYIVYTDAAGIRRTAYSKQINVFDGRLQNWA